MKKSLKTLALFFSLSLLLGSCTKTEYDLDGSLHGIVSEAGTGEPVNAATIALSPGGRTTVSGSDGQYEFLELDAGQYTITVQKEGFLTNRKNVTAVTGQPTRADIPLTRK